MPKSRAVKPHLQLCHAVTASAAMRKHKVIYIDTSNSFSPQRILNFCGMKVATSARLTFAPLSTESLVSLHAQTPSTQRCSHTPLPTDKKHDPRASNILSQIAHIGVFDVMDLIQTLETIRRVCLYISIIIIRAVH